MKDLNWKAIFKGFAVCIAAQLALYLTFMGLVAVILMAHNIPVSKFSNSLIVASLVPRPLIIGFRASLLCCIVGAGYISAGIATQRKILHTFLLGALMSLLMACFLCLAATLMAAAHQRFTTNWSNLLWPLPASLLGGFLRSRKSQKLRTELLQPPIPLP